MSSQKKKALPFWSNCTETFKSVQILPEKFKLLKDPVQNDFQDRSVSNSFVLQPHFFVLRLFLLSPSVALEGHAFSLNCHPIQEK